MTSCSKFGCLYVADRSANVVHRVELRGKTTRWKVNDTPQGLSVTQQPDCLVLVTCCETRTLRRFTTEGRLMKVTQLQEDLVRPFHASGCVVCHGWLDDPLHAVSMIDSDGHVDRSFGGPSGSSLPERQLNNPRHLAVDTEGNVLVADCCNERILLLNSTLSNVRELISGPSFGRPTPTKPWRLCLDEVRGMLFVVDGDEKHSDILIFQVKCAGLVTC